MKAFFLTGTIFFAVLLLILVFENMGISLSGFLFIFFPVDSSFAALMSIGGVGMFFGIFLTGLIMHLLKKGDEEDAPNPSW